MLNMDFTQPLFIDTNKVNWVVSPMPGVYRKPLAREEAERGHATSLVRYDAGSVFRPHPHPLGEEILVLQGVFSDEQGDFSAGSYFRNPPGSSHAPYSVEGCLLLVKLHQFQNADLNQVYINSPQIWSSKASETFPLYQFGSERVWLVRIQNGENILAELDLSGSVELFMISGQAQYGDELISSGVWLRDADFSLAHWSVASNCFIWVKSGHF
ncbi:anti-sigma factor [Marinomonas sp. M1K-6]|uniref:Anti-sigma factor n=1 Tax=Marinomonas profundi TaxID=2726122 RepID=A0A847QYD7_9GAMM|nr:cupin domain-containing protein [Marinomonas profundi]NLQ19148.1 anti-sigma factor [Marinomonas profundi]UDV02045.1 cupin domain-containing protein [Marinomonas profundi]